MFALTALMLIIVSTIPISVYSTTYLTEVVSTESTSRSSFPSLAVDADGDIHVAWRDATDYGGSGYDSDVFYKAKVGGSWTTTEVVSTESTFVSEAPSLAVDPDGNIHVAWADERSFYDSDVFYKAKVGGSWTTTEVVSTESTGWSGWPSLAVNPDGDIHVAWYDETDYGGSGSDGDVFYKAKVGGSWTITEVVSTESTSASPYPSLAVDAEGDIHVAWNDGTDYGGSGSDIDIFYKAKVGGSWTTIEVVSTESTKGSAIPSLAVDAEGDIHVAWNDGTDYGGSGSDIDIFYKAKVGGSWTTTEVVSTESTAYSGWPSLAVNPEGDIHVAWHDDTDYGGSGSDGDVFYKAKVGGSWTTTEVVSTESTDDSPWPSLAVDPDGGIHVAWTDETDYGGSGSDRDIFYKRVDARARPTIALSVTSGPVGTLVTVQGRWLSPGATIDAISLGGITCGVVCIDISEDGLLFTGEFIVPTVDAIGEYDVVVTDSMSYSGSASFSVTSLSILDADPKYGVPGATISVSGSLLSVLAGEIVTLELRDVTTSVIYDLGVTAITDTDGGFTTTFVVPARSYAEYRLVARQDNWNIRVETPFKIGLVVMILSPNEGLVNLEVTLTAVGFTGGGSWEAFFGEGRSVASGTVSVGSTIADTFNVPNVAPGVYPVIVLDYATGISVSTDFTVTTLPPLTLTLRIEDAAEGVIVHKLGGDVDGPADFSYVDVVADLESSTDQLVNDVPVVLTVPGDIFGNPTDTWLRDTNGGTLVPVACVEPVSGKYQIEANLALSAGVYRKQIVWRFSIRDTVSPQDVEVSADIQFPCNDPDGMATIRVLATGVAEGIFVANRARMYQNYVHDDVTELLQRLYEEAQGAPYTNSPNSVIYYVDRYDNDALNWDNTNVNYASEATANVVANMIDDLIEDWEDDATLYALICGPLHCFEIVFASPEYLLIFGDDQDIPFYRYDDPTNHEGIFNWVCTGVLHPGWCVDSNAPPNVEPAVWATDNDFILTDNVYADLDGGTDWMIGDLELSTGRILGETAADMLSLLDNGVSWNNRDTGGVVMASVSGWELGLEPHVGPGVVDLYDVSDLFVGLGYEVRNDDSPTSEVRTIDVMALYEGGENSWNTNFRNAANDADGMDLFFIGGHNSYDRAVIPGNDFDPSDTPGTYTRFGVDHPVVMIVGCHGGLPVRTGGGLFGGAFNDMVYDLIREGASAYIGATGFSYGSPGDLHDCTNAERMFQSYFHELLSTTGMTSNSIGNALKEAKRNYISPAGNWGDRDNKTVTEFNLYGVPWAFYCYPTLTMIPGIIQIEPDIPYLHNLRFPIDWDIGPVVPWYYGFYTRSYSVDLGLYEVEAMTFDDVIYDLFTIPGDVQAIGDGFPVLPYLEAFILELPVEGKITGVSVSTESNNVPGTFNIPIAIVNPFSEGGISYTEQTDIDYLYPRVEDLVRYQETSEGLLFTLSPVQYNPATDEVVYHESFTIDIVYESPLPVVVREIVTDKSVYVPGDTVGTSTTVVNVGSSEVTLTAILTFRDSFGKAIDMKSSGEFIVPSGGSYDVEIDWIQVLGEGVYLAEVEVMLGDAIVGVSSTRILMTGDGVKGLTPPYGLRVGEAGEFVVECVNYGDSALSKEVSLTIFDSPDGVIIVNLPSRTVTVEAGGIGEAVFSWIPEVPAGSYVAVASVGATYVMEGFTILPVKVDSALVVALERITALEALLDESEAAVVSLTGELEDAVDALSDLESQVQELTEAFESQSVLAGKWQQYTFYAAAAAGVFLLLLLLSLRR